MRATLKTMSASADIGAAQLEEGLERRVQLEGELQKKTRIVEGSKGHMLRAWYWLQQADNSLA